MLNQTVLFMSLILQIAIVLTNLKMHLLTSKICRVRSICLK
ncbi:unnamed protein product [Schistosoma margrebowiei]|uniref:Uncharacterized protein n=1 Tax=Schistosoma margrebowiei TaxID=48269 RepID=A0A183LB20_9TREM|nr:unnamed protein product [Schistosoma margrebowiei]